MGLGSGADRNDNIIIISTGVYPILILGINCIGEKSHRVVHILNVEGCPIDAI